MGVYRGYGAERAQVTSEDYPLCFAVNVRNTMVISRFEYLRMAAALVAPEKAVDYRPDLFGCCLHTYSG